MGKQQNSKAHSFSQSMPRIDSRSTRLTFVPARYATERPTNHLDSNIVLLDSETVRTGNNAVPCGFSEWLLFLLSV